MACQNCGGTGKCPFCQGKGSTKRKERGKRTQTDICIHCGASGKGQVCSGLGSPPRFQK